MNSESTAFVHGVQRLADNPKYGSVDDDVFMSTPPTMTGAFARQSSTGSTGKQLVYCIHGKPSGCCATLVTEDQNSNQKSDQPSQSSITIFSEHCHTNNRETASADHKKARRKLIFASVLCLIFMIGEAIGGYLSSSLAIATDASHLLTDFASFMISLCALWVASRPATRAMPFGWYRAEVLGALTSVLLIWVVTGILLYLAVERIKNMSYSIDANIMLITSIIGLCVNVVMGLTLHQHSHSHGGLETHSHETSGRNSSNNINVRAAYIHVLGDILQSLGVLVAAVVVYFKPEWKIVDPICTFLFSILVLVTTFNILRDTMIVLMEGMPKGVNFTDVLETFLSIDGVVRVHNLRVWALSPDKIALAAHLAVNPGVNTTAVLKQASQKMYRKYNFFDCTLQIEEFETQMENCKQCQTPKC
ncbi:Hypothetical protein CINCED_3A011580 [Cinara cedri]|uniref:Cation efflux protein n=1 Tax=Cinara cedri TaxID=506608 RepID=A0A5E4MJ26_9HEMI|nr:Hypothetical protein CINCED_3A011580 [Cinara cedri]